MNETDSWHVVRTAFDPHSLGAANSIFTISNGYAGLKGNVAEDRDGYYPVTLINGVYDELDMFSLIRASNEERRYLDPRYFDTAGRSPAVANLPNPLAVRLFIENREVSLGRGKVSDFRRILSLRDGIYSYSFTYKDPAGRAVRIEMTRFASMVHAHRVYMRYAVTVLNGDCHVRILSGISGATRSNTTGERQYRVVSLDAAPQRCRLEAVTPARSINVWMQTADVSTAAPDQPALGTLVEHDSVWSVFSFRGGSGACGRIDRHIVMGCSEDARHEATADLESELQASIDEGFDAAVETQQAAWSRIWEQCDVKIDGDDEAQRDLRFCLYHVLAAAPRHASGLSVPVKLLSGEYYQGNTFYDTDVYILPVYTFTQPDLARRCLQWRHIGLEPGRRIARDLGYRGAKFAWQAGPYGEECLGRWWRFTHTNIHVNSDVAYALMQYWRASGDDAFMASCGVDLLVETARFLASRAVYDASRDRYDIHDVAGPDEGHCESTNNFYTNYLAIRNLRWAAQMLAWLHDHHPDAYTACLTRLSVSEDEPQQWNEVADKLTLLFDPQTGIYEQYDGFYRLQPIPPDLLRDRKAWFVTVAPYQALNQPDVLMAMAMFRDDFPVDVRRANWLFYKDKSMNFSSMSFVINSIMAADMGDLNEAYRQFRVCAGVDLDEDLTGRRDTYAGLHGTAAGGAWMAAVFGFGGVRLREDGLQIRPNLPPQWKSLRFRLAYRGNRLDVAIAGHQVTLRTSDDAAAPLRLLVNDQTVTLSPGDTWTS